MMSSMVVHELFNCRRLTAAVGRDGEAAVRYPLLVPGFRRADVSQRQPGGRVNIAQFLTMWHGTISFKR